MNPASVKARLRNLSIHEGKAYDYMHIHYMIERLLYWNHESSFWMETQQ